MLINLISMRRKRHPLFDLDGVLDDMISGWWFGTRLLFFHIVGIIIPIDFHIFQWGSNHQPDLVLFVQDVFDQIILPMDDLIWLDMTTINRRLSEALCCMLFPSPKQLISSGWWRWGYQAMILQGPCVEVLPGFSPLFVEKRFNPPMSTYV